MGLGVSNRGGMESCGAEVGAGCGVGYGAEMKMAAELELKLGRECCAHACVLMLLHLPAMILRCLTLTTY